MPHAPRKYYLITNEQVQAARQVFPQVSDKTWVLTLRRGEEPLVLNKPPHKGVGFLIFTIPEDTQAGLAYRREADVLILVSGETPLAK